MMNRRELLGSAGALSLLPALGMAGGQAQPPAFAALLQLGSSQRGVANHRWARVLGGAVTGGAQVGRVRSGRLDWHVDPASGAVEAKLECEVVGDDGLVYCIREHAIHAAGAGGGRVLLSAAISG
jgi:hypothetical protein